MTNYNKVILAGRLTRDVELKNTSAGTVVAKMSLAINRKPSKEALADETCYVDCTSFGKTAETLGKYVHRGDPLLVEGRLQFSKWADKDGNNRSKLEVIVERFEFLSSGKSEQEPKTNSEPKPEAKDYGEVPF